jgi:hypothetical protein
MTVHVAPANDIVEHAVTGFDCICGPDVEYIDPETGSSYPDGPLVIHHSLDGRELDEDD